jgi:hypothetical protein
MNDPKLDKQLEDIKALMESWKLYHVYLSGIMKGNKEFTGKDENQFLKLKTRIAIYHDVLMDAYENPSRETSATMSGMMEIIERSIMLRQMKKMGEAELKRIEMDWHDAYLLLNDFIGALEEKQAQLEHVSKIHHIMGGFTQSIGSNIKKITSNRGFIGLVVVLAIVIGLIVLPLFGVFDYEFMKENPQSEKVYYIVSDLLRSTVMGDIPYESWDKYYDPIQEAMFDSAESKQEGEVRYDAETAERFDEIKMNNRFLIHSDEDLTGQADEASRKEYLLVESDDEKATVLFLYFPESTDANNIYVNFIEWKNALSDDSDEAQNILADTDANVAWFVYSEDDTMRKNIQKFLTKKKPIKE